MDFSLFQTINQTLTGFNIWSIAFRIIFSALIGGCIGSERGRHGRAAGLRTHILVCLGAAMTALIGVYARHALDFTNNDPLRVAAQVISGIGFLGAGTIMNRNNSQVTGLTTAAGLWATASLGIAVGVGFYWGATVAFIVILITMSLLTRLEREHKAQVGCSYYLEVNDIQRINDLQKIVAVKSAEMQIHSAKSKLPGNVGLELTVPGTHEKNEDFVKSLNQQEYVMLVVPIVK